MFRDNTFPSSGEMFSTEDDIIALPPLLQINNENSLDDVFGSTPPSPNSTDLLDGAIHHSTELSDINRMRSEHSTSGYRDGLSSTKSTTIQEGFDEGYSLGAAFGLEIGAILGVLEGIYVATLALDINMLDEKAKLKEILDDAKKDLNLEQIFARNWWDEDGIWKYPIAENSKDSGEECTFKDVVRYHPSVIKWTRFLNAEVERWGLDVTVMERLEVRRVDSGEIVAREASKR